MKWDKSSTEIAIKYTDFASIVFPNLTNELPENTSIKKHAIKLVEGK